MGTARVALLTTGDEVLDYREAVAFYGGVAQYEEYFAAHGFRNEARQLQEGVQRGDYLSVKHLVTDEMAQTFVVCGTPDEVKKQVERIWTTADSVTALDDFRFGPEGR